jgi:glucuronoarabinoxylan endo-1,4-beta-xylanase
MMTATTKQRAVRLASPRAVSPARLAGLAGVLPALLVAQGCGSTGRNEWTGNSSQAASSVTLPVLPAVIKSASNGLDLDVANVSTTSGAQVWTWSFTGADNQEWTFVPTNGYYEIVSRNSGLCLDITGAATANGSAIEQWTCHAGSNQLWSLQSMNGNVQVVGQGSGRCLQSQGSGNGSALTIWDCGSGTNQQWSVSVAPSNASLPGGAATIQNASNAFLLDDDGASTSNGATVFSWPEDGGKNQDWTFTSMGDGTYELLNVYSGLCLDVPGLSTATGQPMDQWSCNGGTNQRWYLYNLGGKTQIAGQGSSKCLATTGSTDGEPVTIQPCSMTDTTQQWTVAAVGTGGSTSGSSGGTSSGGTSTGGTSSGGGTMCGGGSAQSSDIQIEVTSLEQHITGFGVSSAWAGGFANASDPEYLWSTTTGAGLTLHRIRYGDSLTIAQAAASYGVTVWLTPWGTGSGGSYGGPDTTMETNPNGCTGTMPVLTNPSDWANTLSSWVQNAKSQGVPIYAVSAENEPDSCGINTTTSYSPTELATWIGSYLGPAMSKIGVKVMGPETMNSCGFGSYLSAIQNNSAAYNAVGIFATHQYGCSDPPMEPQFNQQGKEYWETETYSGPNDDGIDSGISLAQTVQSDMTQSNINAFHWWWLYASDNGGLYNTSTKQWTKRLWTLGNYARFVRPGYKRVDTAGTLPSGVSLSAYINPSNNQVVVVAINGNSSAKTVSFYVTGSNVPCSLTPYETSANDNLAQLSSVSVSGSRATVTLDAMSVVTFVGTP